MPGQHDDRERRIVLAHTFEHFEPVIGTELEVEQYRRDRPLVHPLERFAPAHRLERVVSDVARPLADAEAQGTLVVDDEQRVGGVSAAQSILSGCLLAVAEKNR